jgi:hypothetical protein
MTEGQVVTRAPPAITGGKRYVMSETPGAPKVLCLDAAPLLEPADAGQIVVTGSHAALFRGRPDDVVKYDVAAIFFSDAGVGLDNAGIARLPDLDRRGIPAAAVDANSAPIGDARAIYADGIISHVNRAATALGGEPGMQLRVFIDHLISLKTEQD